MVRCQMAAIHDRSKQVMNAQTFWSCAVVSIMQLREDKYLFDPRSPLEEEGGHPSYLFRRDRKICGHGRVAQRVEFSGGMIAKGSRWEPEPSFRSMSGGTVTRMKSKQGIGAKEWQGRRKVQEL